MEVACWAHARRKFFDARETDSARAAAMLGMIQELYAVEDLAKARIAMTVDCTAEQADAIRRELRQEKAVPILAKIKAWLQKEKDLVLPRSPMAAAIGYTLNQWDALCRYCEAGYLDIDNNAAERAMKRVAIGRKNWLFAGNDEFGQHHAVLWSLIASAEAQGIDPQAYLRSVLAKIGPTSMGDLEQFLPDVWKREQEEQKQRAAAAATGASTGGDGGKVAGDAGSPAPAVGARPAGAITSPSAAPRSMTGAAEDKPSSQTP
jgi:hypothetical protein